jgi:hypothetical protein
MDAPYLSSDESIVLIAHDVVVSGARIEVILTSKRLLFITSGKDQIRHDEIPFESIRSVVAGENALQEPTLAITTSAPSGEEKTTEIIFFRRPGIEKEGERNQLVAKLKERISPSLVHTAPVVVPRAHSKAAGAETGTGNGAEPPARRPPAQEWSPVMPQYNAQTPPPDPSVRLKFNAITVIIILIVAVVFGAIVYGQLTKGRAADRAGNATAPAATTQAITGTGPAPAQTIAQAPVPAVTALPTSPPQVLIPQTGIWVRVNYSGTFSGSLGTSKLMRQVNASGDQFYQLPTRGGIVDVSVQKQEGTRDELFVEVYRDGSLIRRSTTTTPRGTVDLHVPI